MFGNDRLAEKGPSVEPGSRPRGRHRERWILIFRLRKVAGGGERGELFRVPLIDSAKSAELALDSVEVAVMISVARDETVAADKIVGFYALDNVHWKVK